MSLWTNLFCFILIFVAGAMCYPTCIIAQDVDLYDAVVLPNGTTADTLKYWTLPTTVQVRRPRKPAGCVVKAWTPARRVNSCHVAMPRLIGLN